MNIKNKLLMFTAALLLAIQAQVALFMLGRFLSWSIPEMMFYAFFCVVLFALAYGFKRIWRHQWDMPTFLPRLYFFLVLEGVLTSIIVLSLFKTVIYDGQSQLAQCWLGLSLAAAMIHKINARGFYAWIKTLKRLTVQAQTQAVLRPLAELFFPVFIVLLIYIPDVEAVVARIFIGEQFHHWDSSILAPGCAYTAGSLLDVDVISRYGLGFPMLLAELSKIFGGFSFEHLLSALMWLVIVYYMGAYFLLRAWFKSSVLALATIIVAIKVQMFHGESMPICFTYPSATVLRFCYDLPMMALILLHLRNPKRVYLLAASIACGVQLFHITPEGVYLTLGYYFYLFALLCLKEYRPLVFKGMRDSYFLIACGMLAPLTMLALMRLYAGAYFWQPEFWQNSFQFLSYYANGMSLTPMYQSLVDHNFWAFIVSIMYPLVYVATILIVCTLCFLRLMPFHYIFVAMLSVYGLGLYHYYVGMSATTSYYASGLPYVFVLGFWINEAIKRYASSNKGMIRLSLLFFAVFCLFTTHLFVSYPNIFCPSRNPMTDARIIKIPPGRVSYFNHLFREYPESFKLPLNSLGEREEDLRMEKDFASDDELKKFYRQEFDFKEDAALISSLTMAHEPVALLSSFEARMLQLANRKPFFFFFPLVNSRPLRMRMFVVPNYFTIDDTARTLKQMETVKPRFVFMEKIFLNRQVPQAYYHDSQGFMEVVDFVNDHYTPFAQGKYLMALKRNDAGV